MKKGDKPKILIIASVSSTLWVFYRGLIQRLSRDGYEVTIAAKNDYNLNIFREKYGCNVLPLEIQRKVSPVQDIKLIAKLVHHIRKCNYQIVHAHTPKAGMIGMIASWIVRVPNRIYTLHGLPLETAKGFKRIIYGVVERTTLKCATVRLIVSRSLQEKIAEINVCQKDACEIIADGSACGVDTDRFRPTVNLQDRQRLRKSLDIPNDAFVIGFVGRITQDKGIDCLLDSFASVMKSCANVYLLLIGDYDSARDKTTEIYREIIEINPQIRYRSFVEDIVPYYHIMDILVLPSKREGFNYALLEAAACGLPSVTSMSTGCIDAVVNEETGFIVPTGNSELLSKAVVSLINDARLREKMGVNARDRVVKFFNQERLIHEHMDLYKRLLEKTPN